ncbi:hypothetical protein DB31_3813 [Hyalangium minutum]|uniref:Uncharacterized protein n=2 Tax=Hyalangium minutum TaxID=394096 RepID=A0A085W4T6_9BACT|nr:hypothetical protein DB31_3813 [Hyalangium minutum]
MPLGYLEHFYERDQLDKVTIDGKPYRIPKEESPNLRDTGLFRPNNKPIKGITVPLRLVLEDATGKDHTLDEEVVFSNSTQHCLLGRISFFEQLGLIFMNDPARRWFGLFNLR